MKVRQAWLLIGALGSALVLSATAARAQGGFLTFEFNFSNPGARSLGFGGAFVALADDATAAFANPAGLVQLIEPEVSLEGRARYYTTTFTQSGRISGEATGFGLDVFSGLVAGESNQTASGVSFMSFVYPRERWAIAVYRHQLATFQFGGATQGIFAVPFPPDTGFRRENDRRFWTDYDFVSTGLAAAWRPWDELSIGLGLVQFDLSIDATEELYSFDSLDRFFAPNSYLPGRNTQNNVFSLAETDWGFNAGLLWRLSQRWSLGASYRDGPEVDDFVVEILSGAANTAVPPGTLVFSTSSPIEFPNALGAGAAFRSPNDRLTVSFEWDRIGYSRIIESLTFDNQAEIDDVDEIHLGAEYVFPARRPVLALRGGTWLDPDHRLRTPEADNVDRALFRGGEDQLHLSLGLGLAWQRVQLDFAVDVSDAVGTASLSTIYRW